MPARRKYSPEFKREEVEMTWSIDVSVGRIDRELGLNAGMLGRWRREIDSDRVGAFKGRGVPRNEEMVSFKRELVWVKMEWDFLHEAAAVSPR